jgi:hypothetical protein
MAGQEVVQFSAEGVTITIPSQARQIKVRKLPLGSLQNMKPIPGGFQPGRLVLNFELYDEDAPETTLEQLEQPFEFRIRYTKADYDNAQKSGKPLALAFWDGRSWVQFTNEKHQFRLEPDPAPGNGGSGYAKIKRWGDPPIAWGK